MQPPPRGRAAPPVDDRTPDRARPPKRKRPLPVRLVRGVMKLALLLLVGWALTFASIAFYGSRDEARKADAIVVLGAAQYNGHPSPVLQARLDHAIELYRNGTAKTLIMTGGQAPGDTVSEAVVSRRYAVRAGVPRGAILVETTGMTTRESMRAVGGLMNDRRMKSAVLVSDPFHMMRLKLLAWHVGFTGYTSPTRTSPISRNPGEERKFMLRESIGLPAVLFGLA